MFTLANQQKDLSLALRQAGIIPHKAFASLAVRHRLNPEDALALAQTHGQPAKIEHMLDRGFKPDQVLTVYEASEAYSDTVHFKQPQNAPLNLLADFAEWFLGPEFTEDELIDAIELARSLGSHRNGGYPLSGELGYVLGWAKGIKEHDLHQLEEIIWKGSDDAPEEGFDLESAEGQGDFDT